MLQSGGWQFRVDLCVWNLPVTSTHLFMASLYLLAFVPAFYTAGCALSISFWHAQMKYSMAAGWSKSTRTTELCSHTNKGAFANFSSDFFAFLWCKWGLNKKKLNVKLHQSWWCQPLGSEGKGEKRVHYLNSRQVHNVIEIIVVLRRY